MKLDRNKIFSFMLAAVFALALAGCGGGGGTAAEPEPTPMVCPEGTSGTYPDCMTPAQIEAQKLKEAQDAAMAAYMAAMAAVGSAVDPVAMANAQAQADKAKGASDSAAAATTSAMAEEYQMKAEMYRDNARTASMTAALGVARLANTIINRADIDNAVLEGKTGSDVPKPVSNAVRVGAALALSADAANAASSDNMSTSQGTPAVSTTATYNAKGPRFTVTGVTVGRGENPTSLQTRGGWMGAELVGGATGAGNSMTYANVFTDIQAPVAKQNYGTPATVTVPTDGTTSIVTGDIPGDGSDFTGTYNSNDADNDPPVSGMFSCPDATACSISVDEDGKLVAIQGYQFAAIASGTTPTPDADYLAWGVWLTVPSDVPVDGTPNLATTGAFASGNDPFNVMAALKGTATYTGVATGLYSAAGMVNYFDADAMLEANFGGNVGADNDPDTAGNDGLLIGAVSGSITNIRAGGVSVGGSLTLKRATIVAGAANGNVETGFRGTTSGTLAGRTMAGDWGAQFYGPNKATGKGIDTEYPTTAAGTFGATAPGNSGDTISILGAFGTRKSD